MSKKKNKFDLTQMIHEGGIRDGEILHFVSDPTKTCQVTKQPNGEYKVCAKGETYTVHGFAQYCLGVEPPVHATKWLRTGDGRIVYDIWHQEDLAQAA